MDELPINKVLCGNVLDVLADFPEESIDFVMFSPPYYGLRNYGEETVTIWGGVPSCKHEWKEEKMSLVHENRNFQRGTQEDVHGKKPTVFIKKFDIKKSGFCVKCGAWRGQLGLEPSWRMYIDHMVEVCREIWRVLKKTGSMYINIGDTYAGSHCGRGDKTLFQNYRRIKVAGNLYDKASPQSKTIDYKPKCLMGIPWRLAFALIDDGWILRNEIIWHKPNAMPSSVKDRLTTTHEKIFHFVKQRKYYYDLDAIREPHKVSTLKRDRYPHSGGGPYAVSRKRKPGEFKHPLGKNPGDVIRSSKYLDEQIHKIQGAWKKYAPRITHPKGRNPGDVFLKQDNVPSRNINIYKGFNARYVPRLDGRNPGDFWSITTKPFPEAHFAVYPEDLCVKPILSSCPPDGIVLDPMCGSGTTLVVAKKLGRKYIGIDINPEYVEMAKRRLSKVPERLDQYFSDYMRNTNKEK